MAAVSLSELSMAYEFVSGAQLLEAEALICRASGKIYWRGDDIDEPLPDDIDDTEKYIPVPHKHDLDLGKELVWQFVAEVVPDAQEDVRTFFTREGAYRRFKELLERRGLLDRWYKYEERATEEALKEWCEENGLRVVD